jgi:hypothetical protein
MEKLSKWKFLIKGPSRGMVGIMRRAACLGEGRGSKLPQTWVVWAARCGGGGGGLILGEDDAIV